MNHLLLILGAAAYFLSFGFYTRFLYTGKAVVGQLGTMFLAAGLIAHYFALLERSHGSSCSGRPHGRAACARDRLRVSRDAEHSGVLRIRAFLRLKPHFSVGRAAVAQPPAGGCSLETASSRTARTDEPEQRTCGTCLDRHRHGAGICLGGPSDGASVAFRSEIHRDPCSLVALHRVFPAGADHGV